MNMRMFFRQWGYCWLFLFILSAETFAGQCSVITTIFPLQEFAQAVGGERIKAYQLLPPGAEAHTWTPKPSDMVKLSQADVFIYLGAEMEPWVPEVLESLDNPHLATLEVSQGFVFLEADHGEKEHHHHDHASGEAGVDPHIWLNFAYAQKIVDAIAEALSKKDPGGLEEYRKNAQAYKTKLQELDQRYREELSTCETKVFIMGGHAAFGYLANRYGLTQVPLYGISPNAEPTPRKMAELIARAKAYQVKAVYYEELVSSKLAEVIAREVGVKALVLNPGANLTRKQIEAGVNFLTLMEQNLENLKNGLACR